jgi:hypothetical protein
MSGEFQITIRVTESEGSWWYSVHTGHKRLGSGPQLVCAGDATTAFQEAQIFAAGVVRGWTLEPCLPVDPMPGKEGAK